MSITHEDIAAPNLDNLKTGILSKAAEEALFTEPNYGLTRPTLTRFPTYEDFRRRKLNASHNQGWFQGISTSGEPDRGIHKAWRATPSFQRLIIVRPDLIADIALSQKEDEAVAVDRSHWPSQETDELLWQAYELMADLTDIHDEELVPYCLSQNKPMVDGYIDPDCLMI